HHVLTGPDGTPMFRPERTSHRKTYAVCGKANRQYCIAHCMFRFNAEAERTRIRCRINHCRKGNIEVAVPVFPDGLLTEAERFKAAVPGHAAQKEKIRAFIAENFNRKISTSDLAGHLSLSVTRTCHTVRETCGKPFSELLTDERLAHAELFLRHTDYRIGEIAELCGFPSVEHFTRTFHRRNRMSPGQFRKSIRN
ncbi:MAG: helix-turn-helix transcriptional regulator, partial [Lentisphaeria bacterium]|nr:helix-turn-helix transcriptional regulator [Lentisphaeria bacterium]